MQADNIFLLSLVLDTPDACQNVRFIRNQSLAKLFVGERKRRLARAKRRAEARGEAFLPYIAVESREVGIFHSALMQSASNGHSYVLYIQKHQYDKNQSFDYSSYGLASNELYMGNVPDLGAIISTLF